MVKNVNAKTWLPMYLAFLWYSRSINSEVYESIQWSPFNPKFQFTEDQFKHNIAYYRQIVLPESQINIICPNVATVLTSLTEYPLRDSLYENLWTVGEEEFYSCQINSSKSDSRLVLMCNKPDSLHYHTVNFIHSNASVSSSNPVKGSNIYFLATSNGTKESLNQTSEGHCMDPTNGISMRIQFKICENNSTDQSCNNYSRSVKNKTISKDIKACKNITIKRTSLERDLSQERFWEILAIILGVLLVLSFVIHSVLIIRYCVKKNRKPDRQLSQSSQKGSDEPLKSLIVDSYNKKSKHGRVSAAL
ncbi:ephrin-B2a-like isoform X1 [Actinia tenebrosa]|uniref:Ephrin-B2a-like isoform X1 n=1 Tax=Actinia tenebrosa TaxID=6105 RepID=A0A6P8J5W1_ACTTE|nr:ephrin-B2a-like isoform X1 [Actinia tenebrosa]